MIRRNFIKGFSVLSGLGALELSAATISPRSIPNDRTYWLNALIKIVTPVLTDLANDRLKTSMPVESTPGQREERTKVTHLEALGRSLAGLAPWLELKGDGAETAQRKKFIDLALASVGNAVNPAAKDFLNFSDGRQPLVDAAFLAHAFLRAPEALWNGLNDKTKELVVKALISTRAIKPYHSNWLLFTAMVEAALLKFTGTYDAVRIDYAVQQHLAWYKGDGVYGDGPDLHFDYYNSYVIHPMLIDVVKTVYEQKGEMEDLFSSVLKRGQRYAEIQERMISPDGSFPPVGRSLAYRCGAFQLLAQMALQKQLPSSLKPSQVRSALTAVIKRTIDPPQTFDGKGWLTIGLAGHQPSIGEHYISTGSLYLCTTAFLPLGLPATDEFWAGPSMEWTSLKAFSGKDFPTDKAISS